MFRCNVRDQTMQHLQDEKGIIMVVSRKAKKPIATTPAPTVSIRKRLSEPTTWAGIFTMLAAAMTGGTSLLTDPTVLTQVATGIALVLAKEP